MSKGVGVLGRVKDALAKVGIKAPWAVSKGAGGGGAGTCRAS